MGIWRFFVARGEQWSFVLPKDEILRKVAQTTEKKRISPLCSSGLYYFRRVADFKAAFESMLKNNAKSKGEYYIAPIYNALISQGRDIRYHEINPNQIIFCGTPSEYENRKSKGEKMKKTDFKHQSTKTPCNLLFWTFKDIQPNLRIVF